jgi:nucleotide-binding universal stress UspA family protein
LRYTVVVDEDHNVAIADHVDMAPRPRGGGRKVARATQRVVVAYDGSASAHRALEHAAGLVDRGGTVGVVNVIAVQSVGARLETVSDAQRTEQDHLLREAEQVLTRRGVYAQPIRAAGDPATEILSAAEAIDADVLVVGRTRRRALPPHRSLTGTLTRRASCDVLVVH